MKPLGANVSVSLPPMRAEIIHTGGDMAAKKEKPAKPEKEKLRRPGTMKGEYFEVFIQIAGRDGTQRLQLENKRESIRQAQRILRLSEFGSAATVTLVIPRPGHAKGDRRTMIWQGHVAKSARGLNRVVQDEL